MHAFKEKAGAFKRTHIVGRRSCPPLGLTVMCYRSRLLMCPGVFMKWNGEDVGLHCQIVGRNGIDSVPYLRIIGWRRALVESHANPDS